MLNALVPQPPAEQSARVVPPLVQPLVESARNVDSLTSALQCIVRSLGFDWFMVAVGATTQPTQETRAFVWTSLPADWVRRYDQKAYVEVDPRLRAVWQTAAPLIWDQRTFRDAASAEFLKDAASYGVCSGVAVPLFHPYHVRGIFTLSSSVAVMSAERQREVQDAVGAVSVLAAYTYDLFLLRVVEDALPPPTQGAALSQRELECLRLVGKGLSSPDIGKIMGVGERTIEYHVCNVLSKLGVANRREAVAKALGAGLIEL
ncbi:MAG: LuxR family transcriptional regulator [Burkholderiales bacterium]